MRWDDLFADLEAQAELLARRDRADEVGERSRIELGRIAGLDRLRPAVGATVSVAALGGERVDGVLRKVGAQWLLIEEQQGREAIVPLASVLAVAGLGRRVTDPDSVSVIESRLGLRSALRGLARDRAAVRVHLVDTHELDGTIDRVGADFFELARHARGEPRRRADVHTVQLVFNAAVSVIRREY
jgi:hypothetical protein